MGQIKSFNLKIEIDDLFGDEEENFEIETE